MQSPTTNSWTTFHMFLTWMKRSRLETFLSFPVDTFLLFLHPSPPSSIIIHYHTSPSLLSLLLSLLLTLLTHLLLFLIRSFSLSPHLQIMYRELKVQGQIQHQDSTRKKKSAWRRNSFQSHFLIMIFYHCQYLNWFDLKMISDELIRFKNDFKRIDSIWKRIDSIPRFVRMTHIRFQRFC